MRKKLIIAVSTALILFGAVLGLRTLREKAVQSGSLEGYNVFGDIISVPVWNDEKSDQRVLRVKKKGEAETDVTNLITHFSSDESISEIVENNKEIYIGPYTLYDSGIKEDSELFFANNNYYALTYNKENDLPYSLYNCCSVSNFTGDNVFVPMPVITYMSQKSIDFMRDDLHKNYLREDIYQYCTFEQAKVFYERLDSRYVSINEKKQVIEVQGYTHRDPRYFTPIRFDFAKQTVAVKNKKGKWKVYDGE